jgi:thioredoxin
MIKIFEYKKNKLLIFSGVVLSLMFFIGCSSSAHEMNGHPQLYASEDGINILKQETETVEEILANSDEENKPINITSEQFIKLVADYRKEWKYIGKKPSVVDFYADWCRPCRMMEPAFAKISEKYAGKVNFYKINVDYNKDISNAYQITGIPTLFFCSMDGKLNRIAGYQSEEQLEAYVKMIIAKNE